MAKYSLDTIPPGETKRIRDMSLVEYRAWQGRCGGRSNSPKKIRSRKLAGKSTKEFYRAYKRVMTYPGRYMNVDDATCLKRIASELKVSPVRAAKILTKARAEKAKV